MTLHKTREDFVSKLRKFSNVHLRFLLAPVVSYSFHSYKEDLLVGVVIFFGASLNSNDQSHLSFRTLIVLIGSSNLSLSLYLQNLYQTVLFVAKD